MVDSMDMYFALRRVRIIYSKLKKQKEEKIWSDDYWQGRRDALVEIIHTFEKTR